MQQVVGAVLAMAQTWTVSFMHMDIRCLQKDKAGFVAL